jgi:outer membrane receptor protein involved in Fe transport
VQATNPQHTYNTLADLIADNASRITINFGIPDRGLSTTNTGYFLQDEWRASRRLQVNIGLRYEYYTPLTGAFNLPAPIHLAPWGPKVKRCFTPTATTLLRAWESSSIQWATRSW